MSNNQLSDYTNFNPETVCFSKPEVGNIPGQKISFKRVRMACKYPTGGMGDLIFSTPDKLHSFGLQESRDMATNKLNGYVLPLCLWSRNGPTEDEKKFTDMFNMVTDHCKKYLVEHKEEIEKYDLDYSDLKKLNPLFFKMDKGKIVEGRGPMLYCKVLLNKKQNKINTIFVDEETNREIDPFTMLNKPCNVTAAIKFESIFIGNKVSLQVKLYEVVVRQIDNSIRGLLRPNAFKREKEQFDDEENEEAKSDALTSASVGKPLQVNIYNSSEDDDEEEEDEDEPTPSMTTKAGNDEEEEDDEEGSINMDKVEDSPPAPPVEEEVSTAKKRAPAKPRAKKA